MINLNEINECMSKSTRKIGNRKSEYNPKEIEKFVYSKKWFKTSFGKKLVEQVDEIKEVLQKLSSLTLNFNEFFRILDKTLKSSDIKEKITSEGISEELYKFATKELRESNLEIFRTEDNKRFCSFFILSLYAYVDNYCQILIRAFLRKQHFKQHIIEEINKERKKTIIDIKNVSAKNINEKILRQFPSSPGKKLNKILDYFSLKKRLHKFLKDENLEEFLQMFDGFILIRNKLAPTAPILTIEKIKLSKVVHENIEKYSRKALEAQINAKEDMKSIKQPNLDLYWNFITGWFNELIFPLSTASTFIKATMVYLSIIDQIAGEIIYTYKH